MNTAAHPPEQPVVVKEYTIARELFTTGFAHGEGPCRCSSNCCIHGVYLDVRERDRILAHKEEIARRMDSTQTTDAARWFDDPVREDTDFPSGRCVGTMVVNGKCAFLDGHGRCSLQVAATTEGMDRWALKPLYCILFPIEISEGVVSFDPYLQDEESCCSTRERFDVPLFQACRDELTHLLGPDGYRMLEDAYAGMQNGKAGTRTA